MTPEAHKQFTERLNDLKLRHFECDLDTLPNIHREDLVGKRGSFSCLSDEGKSAAFYAELLALVRDANFLLFSVVVDKPSHASKQYRGLKHPYHYALKALMERYCSYLAYSGAVGDVLAEVRGQSEDRTLIKEYEQIYENGTPYLSREKAQKVLTSRSLKLKPKAAGVCGLQLADLFAPSVCIDVIRAHNHRTPAPAEKWLDGELIKIA